MDFKSLVKNASVAFLAQGIAMLVSLLTTLFVPKILGVEEYGYWQLFIFYASYVGFGHLGLNDGVYLINGGVPRAEIDKRSVSSQMVVALGFQAVLSMALLAIYHTIDLGPKRDFVIAATAVYMIIQNTATYIGYVFQAMNETVLYSRSMIIERVAFALPMLLLLLMGVASFELYVLAYCVSSVVQLAYCLWNARDFFRVGLYPLDRAVAESAESIRVGIKLMLANIASQLVLGVARFIIDAVWGIKTFGELSLSLSMVNFFLAFISQASMVLFPALRQSDPGEQKRFYIAARDTMSLLFPVAYLLFFPIAWALRLWLPAYASSIAYFSYLMPICVFDSKMSISCTTLFKVRREEKTLFLINVCTTAVSSAGALVGAYVFDSITVVIGAVTFAIVLRSLFSEGLLTYRIKAYSGVRIIVSEIIVTLLFLFVTAGLGFTPLSAALYLCVYAAFAAFNWSEMRQVLLQIRRVATRTR